MLRENNRKQRSNREEKYRKVKRWKNKEYINSSKTQKGKELQYHSSRFLLRVGLPIEKISKNLKFWDFLKTFQR